MSTNGNIYQKRSGAIGESDSKSIQNMRYRGKYPHNDFIQGLANYLRFDLQKALSYI